ncbi:MAG: NAD(+) synthase [Lachnospiraceae bacterium]|nr:NAD(+) synthase [Lachnospiraceae bacterium]
MHNGFVKVAAVTPEVRVADTEFNKREIIGKIGEASSRGAEIIVFPELCITSYTCGDLFLQKTLLSRAVEALVYIKKYSGNSLVFVGLPFAFRGKVYNVAAAVHKGHILALIPKRNIPNYSEFYEKRYFAEGEKGIVYINIGEDRVPFGTNILLEGSNGYDGVIVGTEICEDAWVIDNPSAAHARAGANLIVNLSASDEVVGKDDYRRNLISSLSARLVSGYVYSCAGEGESTQDLIFGGGSIIAENGRILSEAVLFENSITYADIDMQKLSAERRRMNTFESFINEDYLHVNFELTSAGFKPEKRPERYPFVPDDETARSRRCEQILSIQAMGLKKRLKHTGATKAVIGLSGGLDSTLAFLVMVRAFDALSLPRGNMIAVTMPGFGTTDRTYNNALELAKSFGAEVREISIREAVRQHFKDIGHDESVHDVTYENAQARERTQILMDVANAEGGLVIGTGDLSELALGWATYNGDHMSMYAVNAGVPKTLVRHLVRYEADNSGSEVLSRVLRDVLETPVSPELLPPENGEISQKTEDLVGPYELHDFFLYYVLRYGFEPVKIFDLASLAFEEEYNGETVLKWLRIFYRRFFSQQFKRSCLPDGPKVGTVAVSPRGDLRMPSDAEAKIWLSQLDEI